LTSTLAESRIAVRAGRGWAAARPPFAPAADTPVLLPSHQPRPHEPVDEQRTHSRFYSNTRESLLQAARCILTTASLLAAVLEFSQTPPSPPSSLFKRNHPPSAPRNPFLTNTPPLYRLFLSQDHMSEVQSRPATRGRSSARGGRGGYPSRGPRSNSKQTNGDHYGSTHVDTSADQGELGELKRQYLSQLTTLKELFPDWADVDLLLALQETDGDLQSTIERITEGMHFWSRPRPLDTIPSN